MTRAASDAPSNPGALADASRPTRRWRRAVGIVIVGAVIAAVFLGLRYRLAITPPLAETYYDEALTGLMAIAILHGSPQVFYWGEPYGGAIGDAYPAAIGFSLFGSSTLVLRMAAAVIAVLWAWALWFVAYRAGAGRFAVLAGLLVAVPPIFLSYAQLSTHGESSALAFATVAVAAAVSLVESRSAHTRAWAWALLGIASGLSWWSSQIGAVLLLAAALALLVSRPESLRGPGPYVATGLFLLASWPFWTWNATHEWATFRHLATWGGTMPPWGLRPQIVVFTLLDSLRGAFWDGRTVQLSRGANLLGWAVIWGVYVPGVVIAVARVLTWAQRLHRNERPWQDPLDVVVVAFWGTVAAHLVTWFGTSTVLRYEITFQGILPVLCAVALARLARAWAPAAVALAAALLGFNLLTHVAFVRQGATEPWRPVDAAIKRLEALGIRYCYADTRVAQVIAFESTGRVLCSDFVGYRNYTFLQEVDRVEDPTTVAIVAHSSLRRPHPDVMARTLDLAGVRYQRDDVGEFSIFHHFVPPDPVAPIAPAGWVTQTSAGGETTHLAFDRRVWTRWSAAQQSGTWFEVDLGQAYPVAQVSLLAAPWSDDAPDGLRVETSLDRSAWRQVASVDEVFAGLHWWRGHPRFDDTGRVIVRMDPLPTRYVRLTRIGTRDNSDALWSIAELFVYEPNAKPWEPPPAAVVAEAAATRELDHWMDDPAGPNPIRAPVTYEHRRAQVPWAGAFADATRALALAPEWEDAHNLYGEALVRSGWSETFDVSVERAARDHAWGEVVRWAEEADKVPEGLWRRGRLTRWAEALDHLGRSEDAAAIRRRSEPAPETPTKTRFGEALDLVGVDIPREVRAGDTVTVRYHWRLVQTLRYDYWAFLHIRGLRGTPSQDRAIGAWDFGTSRWTPGEEVRQSVTFRLPPDTTPGQYALHTGVWLPGTGKQLHAATTLPVVRRAVVIGSLHVSR